MNQPVYLNVTGGFYGFVAVPHMSNKKYLGCFEYIWDYTTLYRVKLYPIIEIPINQPSHKGFVVVVRRPRPVSSRLAPPAPCVTRFCPEKG